MDEKWMVHLEEIVKDEVDSVELAECREQEILAKVHRQIEERRGIMRISKRKLAVAFVAALAVMGTITAVAAGRVTGLISSTNRDEAVHTAAELRAKVREQIGDEVKLVDGFSGGIAFKEGHVAMVEGVDEEQNTVLTYPEMYAFYENGVNLSAFRKMSEIPEDGGEPDRQEEYKGIQLEAKEDQYLFLPPDATPSEEDMKLQEEGKLYISYGSSEEERKAFRNISWEEGGIEYLLFTYEDMDMDTLLGMAREVIDAGQD